MFMIQATGLGKMFQRKISLKHKTNTKIKLSFLKTHQIEMLDSEIGRVNKP
jgi:hypothetical protein